MLHDVPMFVFHPRKQPLAALLPLETDAMTDPTTAAVCCRCQEAKRIGEDYLQLEKYANLNYMVRAAAGCLLLDVELDTATQVVPHVILSALS